MPRKASEAVPEGNGPVPQKEELGSGQLTWGDVYRVMEAAFDRWDKKLDEISDERRKMDQHVTSLEHGARQPRFAMEADGQAKTRERTEGAATAVQVMCGDCFSARWVESGPNTNSISFGVKDEPPALPCRDDVVVECGAAASESCLPSLEMRPSTAAGGLVPTGEASKVTETNHNQPPLRLCSTEERDHLEANRKKNQFHPPQTTAAASSRRGTCLLLLIAGGSLTQNPGKIGPLIQAVRKVTSAPAHFWDCGARWFVARFFGLGQLVKSSSVFSEKIRWFFKKGRF